MLPYYPFFWADYSSKTFDLTMEQHGAYILLLRYIYTTGKPIPHEERFSITKAKLKLSQKNTAIILEKFFVRDGNFWKNTRCEEIIKEQNSRHLERVSSGRKGAIAKAKKNKNKGSSSAKAQLKLRSSNHNQIIDINNKKKKILKEKEKTKFVKPTLEDIKKYCIQRKNKVNPQKFFNNYEAKGWKMGKTNIVDWKAAVHTWENNNNLFGESNGAFNNLETQFKTICKVNNSGTTFKIKG